MNDLRLLVVADDPLARAGLAAVLAEQPGCVVVGQVPGDGDALDMVEAESADLVIWDLGWDPSGSLDTLPELPGTMPPVVALLPDAVHAAEAWSAGVRGLMMRDADTAGLVAALPAVAHGQVVIAPELAEAIMPARGRSPVPPSAELTPREMQVLQVLAEGVPNKAIASRLEISEHTVKFHVNAIMGKLGAQSRTEAVTIATRLGLILL